MKFIGIDPSITSTGLAIYTENPPSFSLQTITTKRASNLWARQWAIAKSIIPFFSADSIVTFEDFGMTAIYNSMGTKYLTERIELCGMLKLAAAVKKAKIFLVKPSQLKMLATGKADAHKEQVRMQIEADYDIKTTNSDEADAFVLMLAGYLLHYYKKPEGEFWLRPDTAKTYQIFTSSKKRLALERIYALNTDALKSISFDF